MVRTFENEIRNLRNSQSLNVKREMVRMLMNKYGLDNWQLTPTRQEKMNQIRNASHMFRPAAPRTPNRTPPARRTATSRRTATNLKKIKKKIVKKIVKKPIKMRL
jgi:hypothetical protein